MNEEQKEEEEEKEGKKRGGGLLKSAVRFLIFSPSPLSRSLGFLCDFARWCWVVGVSTIFQVGFDDCFFPPHQKLSDKGGKL